MNSPVSQHMIRGLLQAFLLPWLVSTSVFFDPGWFVFVVLFRKLLCRRIVGRSSWFFCSYCIPVIRHELWLDMIRFSVNVCMSFPQKDPVSLEELCNVSSLGLLHKGGWASGNVLSSRSMSCA